MGKVAAVAALALICAGCSNPWAEDNLTEAERYRAGWYEPSPRPALAERYCYRTLARVDCHDAPLAGAKGRSVGSFHELAQ